MDNVDTGFTQGEIIVPPEWIDVNHHMNSTHYGLMIYDNHVAFSEEIGLGYSYAKSGKTGKAVVESHLVYEREVSISDVLVVKSWLVGLDAKKLHFYHELHNLTKQCRAAYCEQLDVHMDLVKRCASPIPVELTPLLQQRVEQSKAIAASAKLARSISCL